MRRLIHKIRDTLTSAASILGQRGVPYWPRERLEQVRDLRVRELVRFAADTVPYYRQLFSRLGIDPLTVRCARDLASLPLLDKDTVRRDPPQFVSESPAGRSAWRFTTSGSTGSPLDVYHDQHSTLINTGHNRREDAVVTNLLARTGWRLMPLGFRGNVTDRVSGLLRDVRWGGRARVRNVTVLDSVEAVVAEINRVRPDVIKSYGSYLESFCRTVQAMHLELFRPSLVLHVGDVLTEDGRRLIQEGFGISVISRYAAVEAFKIGFTCEKEPHYHIHEDLVHVRVVNPEGRDLPLGEKGEVVITNLINRGTVLINYRLGDLAAWIAGPCPCGRTSSRLSELDGRVEDVIWLANGHFVHPRAAWRAIRPQPGIVHYQLIQHQIDRLELRLCTMDRGTYDRAVPQILQELGRLLGPDAEIAPIYVSEWKPTEPGKYRAVISKVKRPSGSQDQGQD